MIAIRWAEFLSNEPLHLNEMLTQWIVLTNCYVMLLFDWKLEIRQCCSAYMYSFEVYLSILYAWTLPILTPAWTATQTIFIEHVSRYFNSLYGHSLITCVMFEYWTFILVWTCTSYFSLKRSVVESVTCQRVATSLPATISQHLQSHARLYRYSQIHRHIYRDVLQQFVTQRFHRWVTRQ